MSSANGSNIASVPHALRLAGRGSMAQSVPKNSPSWMIGAGFEDLRHDVDARDRRDVVLDPRWRPPLDTYHSRHLAGGPPPIIP